MPTTCAWSSCRPTRTPWSAGPTSTGTPVTTSSWCGFRVDTASRTLFRDTSDAGDIDFADGTSTRLVGTWLSNNATTPLFRTTTPTATALTCPVSYPDGDIDVKIDLRIDIYTEYAPIAHQLTSVVQPRNLRQY